MFSPICKKAKLTDFSGGEGAEREGGSEEVRKGIERDQTRKQIIREETLGGGRMGNTCAKEGEEGTDWMGKETQRGQMGRKIKYNTNNKV